jgi:hypothetical protein
MTIQEFHIAFNLEIDKTADFELPYMSPEQIDYWLNKAQNRFVSSRAFGTNPLGKAFEENEKRIDDLRTIVERPSAIAAVLLEDNVYIVSLPDDYQYLMRHQCTVISDKYGSKLLKGIQTKQDQIDIYIEDPFWGPSPEEPLYYLLGNNIVYETLGLFTIQDARITYIRIPVKLQYGSQYIDPTDDITCELPVHTHQEIVDIAVSMVLENIESQRYQTNLNELTKTE